MDNTTGKVLGWSAMSMASVLAGGRSTGDLIDRLCAKGEDTSSFKKSRKERARMLSLARQEELKRNPKPPKKKRGKKRK